MSFSNEKSCKWRRTTIFEHSLKTTPIDRGNSCELVSQILVCCMLQGIRNLVSNIAGNHLLFFQQVMSQVAPTASLNFVCCSERKINTFSLFVRLKQSIIEDISTIMESLMAVLLQVTESIFLVTEYVERNAGNF